MLLKKKHENYFGDLLYKNIVEFADKFDKIFKNRILKLAYVEINDILLWF